MKDIKILFLSKDNDHTRKAKEFLLRAFGKDNLYHFYTNKKYDPPPKEIFEIKGDVLISFLSPWVVPKEVLNNFRIAINFHPGSPEYPGTGCYNFALYNDEKEYGVTCHYMSEKVDSGKSIKVKRFPIYEWDTVESLRNRTLDYLVILFYEVMNYIISEKDLPVSSENWKRRPYKRRDLEKLCEISPDMPYEEIKRRVRATYYPNAPGAFVKIGDFIFEYTPRRSNL